MSKTITSYKAFNQDLTCRNFKYEINKEYEHKGEVSPCHSGFYACPAPLSVLSYYPLSSNPRFAVVEQSGEIKDEEDKAASSKITIKAEIGLAGLIKAQIEYVKKCAKGKARAEKDGEHAHSYSGHSVSNGYSGHSVSNGYSGHSVSNGDRGHSVSNGDRGHSVSNGYRGHSVSNGDRGHSVSNGYSGHSVSNGYSGHSVSNGYSGHSVSNGDRGHSVSNGDRGHSVSNGDRGHSVSNGDSGHADARGKNSIAAAFGMRSKCKAAKGNWIVIAEYDDNCDLIHVKTAKVTGRKIKADTWYTLQDGKFVECK